MTGHSEFSEVNAVPARMLERGFLLLALRQVHGGEGPPAFAVIDQHLLRRPERLSRHAVFFACTFRPEIMTWLGGNLGRLAQHDAGGQPQRNPRWPRLGWRSEERTWPDGTRTTEWLVEVAFQDEASWAAFRRQWALRLEGRGEAAASPPPV